MILIKTMAFISAVVLSAGMNGAPQPKQRQPSIAFGIATISLGMTVEEVQKRLAESGRHLEFLDDKVTGLVHAPNEIEGQVTFSGGRAVYAQYQMPNVQTADDLAQEIAGAVDSMETKACEASNYSAHGTGGGFSQSIFQCGSRQFNIMTVQTLGRSTRTINVNIQIGQTVNN
jgi:hypothetical protein